MSKIHESIIMGLTEAVKDAKAGKKVLPRRTVTIAPVKNYNAWEAKTDHLHPEPPAGS